MTTLNDLNKTDGFDHVMAAHVNNLIAASFRSEYQNVETLPTRLVFHRVAWLPWRLWSNAMKYLKIVLTILMFLLANIVFGGFVYLALLAGRAGVG